MSQKKALVWDSAQRYETQGIEKRKQLSNDKQRNIVNM